jgi:hypothetical protein
LSANQRRGDQGDGYGATCAKQNSEVGRNPIAAGNEDLIAGRNGDRLYGARDVKPGRDLAIGAAQLDAFFASHWSQSACTSQDVCCRKRRVNEEKPGLPHLAQHGNAEQRRDPDDRINELARETFAQNTIDFSER